MAEKDYSYVQRTWTHNGHRYKASGKTAREANRKLDKIKERVLAGDVTSSTAEVKTWGETWLRDYIKPKVRAPGAPKLKGTMSEKNYSMYERYVNSYIIPGLNKMKMGEVTDAHLRRIINAEAGKSFSHVSKLRIVIQAMFSQATASRVISYDPSLSLDMPNTTKGSRRSMTDEEREAFIAVSETHRHGLWAMFLLGTGLRPNECSALTVQDLDFDSKMVTVNKAIESGTLRIISDPKTAAGARVVPIPEALIAPLKEHTADKEPDDYVFTLTDGKTLFDMNSVEQAWASYARAMDIYLGAEMNQFGHIYDPKDLSSEGKPLYPDENGQPRNGHKLAQDLTLYCVRHTYATDLQRAGVDINIAKYLMGHKDISTTSNFYIHSGIEDAKTAATALSEYHKRTKCVPNRTGQTSNPLINKVI